MTKIMIDTAQVQNTSNQFNSKRGELDALVSQANNLMNSLQGQFTGQRANAIFGEWQSMQGNLKNAIQTLQQASDLLKRAATDFGTVDSQK